MPPLVTCAFVGRVPTFTLTIAIETPEFHALREALLDYVDPDDPGTYLDPLTVAARTLMDQMDAALESCLLEGPGPFKTTP